MLFLVFISFGWFFVGGALSKYCRVSNGWVAGFMFFKTVIFLVVLFCRKNLYWL